MRPPLPRELQSCSTPPTSLVDLALPACPRGLALRRSLEEVGRSTAAAAAPRQANASARCVAVTRIDDQCETWVSMYHDASIANGSAAILIAMASSPDGSRVFDSGADCDLSRGNPVTDPCVWATVAYDGATGHRLWGTTFSLGGVKAWPSQIVTSPDASTLYLSGGAQLPGDGPFELVTVAYAAADGRLLWKSEHDAQPGLISYGEGEALSRDGRRLVVTGWTDAGIVNHVPIATAQTIAYDTATGAELWSTRSAATSLDEGLDVALSPDGAAVYVIDSRDYGGGFGTVAYSMVDGSVLWSSVYRTPNIVFGYDVPFGLGVSPDGSRLFVAGWSNGAYTTVAYATVAGQRLWVSTWDGVHANDPFGPLCFNGALALVVAPDGTTVFVTGLADDVPEMATSVYGTVAYDAATGAQRWVATSGPAAAENAPVSIAISPDGGRLYVTGYSNDLGGLAGDVFAATFSNRGRLEPPGSVPVAGAQLTVSLDTRNGSQVWAARYASTPSDAGIGIVVTVSADGGRVFVGGYMSHAPSLLPGNVPYDYATARYEAARGCLQTVCL